MNLTFEARKEKAQRTHRFIYLEYWSDKIENFLQVAIDALAVVRYLR